MSTWTWKTRGTIRREAEGEKQIKCHLEFPLTFEKTINGILHRRKENEPLEICQAIKKENWLQSLNLWETEVFGESKTYNQKVGRGAWVKVKASTLCPICFEKESKGSQKRSQK